MARKKVDHAKLRKGILTVASGDPYISSGRFLMCDCECGKVVVVRSSNYLANKHLSCGCRKINLEADKEILRIFIEKLQGHKTPKVFRYRKFRPLTPQERGLVEARMYLASRGNLEYLY